MITLKEVKDGPVRAIKYICDDCTDIHYNLDITLGTPPIGASFGVTLNGELARMLNEVIVKALED